MPYLKITNLEPTDYSVGNLSGDNPNTSFPDNISDATLAEWGVYPYTVLDQPEYDTLVQHAVPARFTQDGSNWVRGWDIEPLPQAEAEENVRNRRNELLSQSDWTQTTDAPVDQAAWAAYRQNLRDVPSQAGFPYSVVWPAKPE